jgi:ATP-dependent Clp protease ATP-binding subunit ClpA
MAETENVEKQQGGAAPVRTYPVPAPEVETTAMALEFSFGDPRFRMTLGGRFLVRTVSYISYLVFAAATITMLISGVAWFFYLGLLLILFFLDRLVHRGQGDRPIARMPRTGNVNIAPSFAPESFSIMERAFDSSLVSKRDFFLEVAHRLAETSYIEEGLRRLDVDPKEFKQKLNELLVVPMDGVSRESLAKKAEILGLAAFGAAFAAGHNFVKASDLFSGLASVEDESVERLFNLFSIDAGDLELALILSAGSARGRFRTPRALGGFIFETHRTIRHRVMNRAWTARPTPTLDRYSDDLTDLARESQIGFLIGHAEEYEKIVTTLARPTNPNALLVGEAGIGKEAIVQHLAFNLVKDNVPRALFDKRLVSLRVESVVAGAKPEELDARLTAIVEEIDMAGNIILYISDIHNLVRTSGAAYMSAADILMPVIMDNRFPILGATYPREFKEFIEPRSDFVGAFEVVPVSEISIAEAERVLSYESLILERDSRITISFGAIRRAVVIAKKYFRDKFLPSSAEELLKGALVSAEQRGEKALGPDRVSAVAEAKTHIPMHEAAGDEAKTLLNMEKLMHERVVGQDEAITAIAQAIREYRSGLTRPGGPIASFLFVGPTGVGKTELAKTLAKIQFGSEKMMTRFDMTEYQDKASFTRFIGSPDGQMKGALTEAVHEKPYSLILLDEFEKAFPDILNLFLQVFDDGRLTDNLDRTVDFTNTIIIATSNAHSDITNESMSKGESMADIAEYLKKRLVDVFKPELLNRFSKIIVFRNLEPAELSKIVLINLAELAATVKAQGIYLSFDPAAVKELVKLGYDPAFGARPLRRVIDEKIRAPLSEAIIAQKIKKGSRVKLILTSDSSFDFEEA